ncbi:MATE family efflux transporter [Citrobacter farmeri]|uniref:hypothetical protein n=1 Tax=Citrobacter farmeri TaxID=67824 RepID=UPI00189B796A|nr:hypothetical protein [Citrobacter farmeri]EKU0078587.1 hypothetical protein [Citrobacter farmeri]MBJ9137653.1 hypothetical protein [Citrobacter farmeri]MDB2167449.1 hypothetical protein [Citrobacter farmeri]MDZ7531689.1 hypothetical protein [Citrobacter farmeri]HED3139570.1 hypothetical protein [Citrobacter farmeri]
MDGRSKNIRRLLVNSLIMYLRMILLMVITLYISRLAINLLGIEKFGLYSVISGFVLLAGVLTNILESTTQRFLSKALGENKKNVSQIFQSCLSAHIFLSLIAVVIIEILGWWFINHKLVQEIISTNDVYIIFTMSVVTFLISVIASPFYAALISLEKANLYAIFTISDVLLKVAFINMVAYFPYETIIGYSFAILAAVLVNRMAIITFFIVKLPLFNCRPTFKFKKIKEVIAFAMWNMWGGAATVLNSQGVNVLINVFFGVIFNTARAITSQVNSAVLQITNSIQLTISPQIVKSYFSDDVNYLNALVIYTSKINVYLTLIIISILSTNVSFLLKVWLNEYPLITVEFINLMFVELFVNCFSASLSTLIQATGKIKNYQLVVGGMMLVNMPLCLLLLKIYNNVELVYYVAILISLICLALRLYFIKILTRISVSQYIKRVIVPGIIVISLCLTIQHQLLSESSDIKSVLFNSILTVIILVPLVLFIGLDRIERAYLLNLGRKYFSKVNK